MTTPTTKAAELPEALRLANVCSNLTRYSMDAHLIAAELRRLHTRTTELESQLAQRFGAADMATASAQGFRDGVASLSLPAAGQEPVAWRTFDGEGGYDYRTHDDNENYRAEWEKRNPNHKGWVEPLYAAPQPAVAAGGINFMRKVVAVAVTMLYDTHPKDVVSAFDFDQLKEMAAIATAMNSQRVEDIYKQAWVALSAAESVPQPAVAAGWLPIESSPRHTKEMFVVRAFDVLINGHKYTSDPYCVWADKAEFVRWPHPFEPTHWMRIPPAPSTEGESNG